MLYLFATVFPKGADTTIVWNNNGSNIATLLGTGFLKPLQNGTLTLTGSYKMNPAYIKSFVITVTNQVQIDSAQIALSDSLSQPILNLNNIPVGQLIKINTTIFPETAPIDSFLFSVNPPDLAQFIDASSFRVKKPGSATITGFFEGINTVVKTISFISTKNNTTGNLSFEAQNKEILVFPNPTKGYCTIRAYKSQALNVSILNASGIEIDCVEGNGVLHLNLSGYSKGMYFFAKRI